MSLARMAAVALPLALVAATATVSAGRQPAAAGPRAAALPPESQWHLFGPQDPHGKPGSINAVGAWKLVRPAEPVVVALLDAGVNWTHPNLAPNIWQNPGEVRKGLADEGSDDVLGGALATAIRSLNGKDDDKNGYVDDIVGWDFAGKDYNPNSEAWGDDFDHGSMLAGLMAAVPTKQVGLAGAGRNLKVMPLRVVGDPKANLAVTVPAAIRYAAHNGARVIVTGLYLPPYLQNQKAFREAMDEARSKGVLVVLAAMRGGGTYAEDMKALAAYPNVLIVGVVRKDGSLRPMGDSHTVVKMVAPGEDMTSISFGATEHWKGPGDVCPATALVAAAAATLLSQQPNLTPEQVIERMQKTARRHPSMDGKMKAGGSLDMEALLKTVSQ